jgi:hypothetical protein
MDSRKFLFTQTGLVFAGEVLCSAAMVGVFALLGKYDSTVLIGAAVGAIAATANFFFMALVASMAAEKAMNQNVKGGEAMIKGSYIARMAVLFVVLYAFVKSGLCNVITLVVPLIFVRPILTIAEFFRKPGELDT